MENASTSELQEAIKKANIYLQLGLSGDGYPLTELDRTQINGVISMCEDELESRA